MHHPLLRMTHSLCRVSALATQCGRERKRLLRLSMSRRQLQVRAVGWRCPQRLTQSTRACDQLPKQPSDHQQQVRERQQAQREVSRFYNVGEVTETLPVDNSVVVQLEALSHRIE